MEGVPNVVEEVAQEGELKEPAHTQPPMSKNQLKKLAKRARVAETQHKKKLEKKEQNRQEKAAKRQRVDTTIAAMTPEESTAFRTSCSEKGVQRKQEKIETQARLDSALKDGVKLIVDLDFHDKMSDKEVKSLVQQLAYCVSCNRKAVSPCSLHFTSFQGQMKEKVDKQFPGYPKWTVGLHEEVFSEAFSGMKDKIVYLTADCDDELTTLEPDCAYVIGGIVDRNRHKLLCLERAKAAGVRTARLPLGDHLKLAGSKVLTVNQVIEILVKYLEVKDWSQACEHVVPIRKVADAAEPKETSRENTKAIDSCRCCPQVEVPCTTPVLAIIGDGREPDDQIQQAVSEKQAKGEIEVEKDSVSAVDGVVRGVGVSGVVAGAVEDSTVEGKCDGDSKLVTDTVVTE